MRGKIIEIFSSIQGEGLWVGRPQVFVRFHGCKLKCNYCDTPLTHQSIVKARVEHPPYSRKFETFLLEFSAPELDAQIGRFGIRSLALTGGEPLEQAPFIRHWLQNSSQRYEVLLETSGVETQGLREVLDLVSIISLDLKLPSSSGEKPLWETHTRFLEMAQAKSHYAKVVFDETMTTEEIAALVALLKKFPKLEMIFQPVSPLQKRDMKKCLALFESMAQKFPERVRLIPQMHKSIGVL